jgi:peptide/nickel transport system substrate-binding protein
MGRGVVLFVALVAVSCTGTGSSRDVRPPEPIVLRVGVPEGNASSEDVGVNQFVDFLRAESLTLNGIDGRAVPRLAERWEWQDKDMALRVVLKPSVFLHDNVPFAGATAANLVREAVTTPANLARYPSFADIETVTALQEHELLIRLKRPSAMLPEDLSVPLGIKRDGGGTGSGPFRIVSKEPVELEAFDRYHLGKPAIDRVIVRKFDGVRAGWASMLRGELDMLYDVPADAVEFIRNDDVEVISVPRWYQYLLAFNSKHPVLKSPFVRKALNIAIDRAEIVKKVLNGAGEASSGPLHPKYWAYDSTQVQYQYDPVGAAALLDAAGFPLPKTASGRGPRARFRFTAVLPQDFAVWEQVALEIQRDLINVGVDMQFKPMPLDQFGDTIGSGAFDAVLADMISGPTPARANLSWRSARRVKGPFNVFGYENSEADRLLESLFRATNEAATRSATAKLQRVMQDDPPALFVAWTTRTRAISKRFAFPGTSRDPLVDISQWRLAEPRPVARR